MAPPAGLPAERTQLSWERSAMGFLVGGALVVLRQNGPLGVGRALLAATAGLLACAVLWAGYRRSRRIKRTQAVPPPRFEVLVLGCSTAVFAAAICAVLLYSW